MRAYSVLFKNVNNKSERRHASILADGIVQAADMAEKVARDNWPEMHVEGILLDYDMGTGDED